MKIPTCGTCPYWHVFPDPDRLETKENASKAQCRRHAPQTIGHSHYESWRSYPFPNWIETERDDWCGDHPDFISYLANVK